MIGRAEILGKPITELYRHLAKPNYLKRLGGVFDAGPPTIFSSQLHPHLIPAPLPDGSLRIQHTLVTAIPAADEKDREEGRCDALLSIQDVTDLSRRLEDYRVLRDQALQEAKDKEREAEEQRRLDAKIQHAQKIESLSMLAGGIAHDLNNLLVGILGNADLALERLKDAKAEGYIRSVIESARRAAELSHQMLAFSGKGALAVRPLSLSKCARDTLRLAKISLPKTTLVRSKFPSQLPVIEVDPAQLRQLVASLVSNASEALGSSGGLVTVSTGVRECEREFLDQCYWGEGLPEGTYVYLEVADTGCGLDQATLDRIFEPFFSTKTSGRGLGLPAVLGIIKGHQGTLRVESELGSGTIFQVFFPSSDREVEGVPQLPSGEVVWRGEGVILVIDDEELVLELAQATLEGVGFDVLTAEGGRQGEELFRANADRIQLVLLDMTMPELSGEEIYRQLRHIRPDIKILLSSGFSEQQAISPFDPKAPVPPFLHKPYRPADLIAKVRQVLSGS